MRRRLLRSTLTIALVAVVTLGVPLLILARHQVWSSAHDTLRQQAASVAAGVEDRLDVGARVDLTRFAEVARGRRITVDGPGGLRTAAGPALPGPVLQASQSVSGYTITVQASRGPTARRADEVTLLVIGLALLAVATAIGLALWQARRLTTPLAQLVDRAHALGRGEFDAVSVPSGIAEIDGIAQVLDRSARELGALIQTQKEFASDAAHQLRTPLTGIGLRLDEMSRLGDEEVRQEAEEALAQVTRLDRVITALLARARGDSAAPELVDLSRLLTQEAAPWTRTLAADGREVHCAVAPGLTVHARREHLHGIVSCLLDNALRHGQGRVEVRGLQVGEVIWVEVTDEGPGVPADLAERVFEREFSGRQGTGIGLALARSLAFGEGGTLAVLVGPSCSWRLSLPAADRSKANG